MGPRRNCSSGSIVGNVQPGVKLVFRGVLGQFASPYFVTRSPATLNVQRVRWAKLAPSCLVWLATCPSTEAKVTHYLPSADRRPRAPLGGGKHENAAGVVRALMTRCEKPPRGAAAGREDGEVNPTVAGAVVILTATLISLAPAALPAEEKNLVAARNGAQVIKYTSQLGGEWRGGGDNSRPHTPAPRA